MSRWFFPWSSSIKKRVCRYLLQHYLGHFLEERLGLEQLSLDLYAGAGRLSRIHLDVWSVNEFLESLGTPLEIVDGFIESISVTIPWSALVTENCTVEVCGLQITCQPKCHSAPGVESQSWASCVTTSMQLAQECLKEPAEEPSESPQPLEGLEMFAQTIETVLRRIQVTFLDTVIRIEHQPHGGQESMALEVHVKRLDYCDEAVKDPGQALSVDIHQPPPFVHKTLRMSGVLLHYEEFVDGGARAPTLLQIGSCSGYTEMRIKLKQNEAFPGPKLELDGKVGSLHLLLTPRQILCLLDLLSSLNLSGELCQQLGKSRPLDSEDLKLIEQDLSHQLHAGLGAPHPLGCVLERPPPPRCVAEMFFSMAPMSSSVSSVRSVSELSEAGLDSSTHSDFSTGRILPHAGKTGSPPPPLPSLESQRPEVLLRVAIGGLTLTLLYQPPGPAPPDTPHLLLAQRFFSQLSGLKDSAFGGRDFQPLRRRFEAACPHSNLRLTGAAVQLSCEHRAAGQLRLLSWDSSFGLLEILECLWPEGSGQREPEYTEVSAGAFPCSQSPRPCARLRCKHSEKRPASKVSVPAPGSQRGLLSPPFTCLLIGTLHRSLLFSLPLPLLGAQVDSPPAAPWHASVQLAAPKATLRLQFPIPDLRPWTERRSWSEKAVRRESLRLDLAAAEACLQLGPEGISQLEGSFGDLHGVYEDGEKLSVPCFRVGKAPDLSAKGAGKKYTLPKITVSFQPQAGEAPWEVALARPEEMELSMAESPCQLKRPEPSPFSSKRTMYETEEMVIPGDPEEMAEFQAQTLGASQYAVEVAFPTVHIFLPSKEFYESLYNRINNDLLMWESCFPPPSSTQPPGGTGSVPSTRASEGPTAFCWQENFKLCKSAFKLDSDSEDEDSHFYSVDEAAAQQRKGEPKSHFPQSCVSVVLRVGKGRVTALCEAKGEGGRKLEGSHGELVLDMESGSLFSVTRYKGREDLGYFCVEAEKVALYHKAVVEDYLVAEHLEIPSFLPPSGLHPTIYASQEGAISWPVGARKEGTPKMLSLAIQIKLDLEKNIKEFLVTLRLEGATLRHHMALTHQSWYTQMIDFLDVLDDPVLGFAPPTIITVLHTHLFSCAVDYRPLYLPVRVLITAETFTLSSNIVVDTSVFLLRFILDDSALYLSNKCDVETGDLRKDYVCVLDVDLLELAITTWKGATTGKLARPLFELRCSNNVLHVHTCPDSCAALANLIQYVVNHGDLRPPPRHDSPTEIAGQKVQLSESPASLPSCPPAETAAINQRDLTDALMDTERSLRELAGEPGKVALPSPVSVYLFPGENGAAGRGRGPVPPPSSAGEGLDFSPSGDSEGEATEDFCILDAPGTGIPPRDGEPVVTKLLEGPVRVQEGHFSRPLGSTDLLKAPPHFPVPKSRILMRDISVVWHLYGGRDFGPGRSQAGLGAGVPSARSSPSRSAVTNRPQNTWRAQGGASRIHDLLMEIQLTKVSFQHEAYASCPPEKPATELEEQPLARQVFLVQELEIRDRLASSQINKFLYLYSSEGMPRRAHSNMVRSRGGWRAWPQGGCPRGPSCRTVPASPCTLGGRESPLLPRPRGLWDEGWKPDFSSSPRPGGLWMCWTAPEGAEGEMTASMETSASENSSLSNASSSDQPIYFRYEEFRFTSEVPIWLDYHGKHVTVDQVGTFAGILIGLAQLNCSELKLKQLCCRHGLLGVEKVVSYALNEWLTDIRKNQLPGILGGVGPMHSVVQLFHGLRDLFWLPIEQYRKDGRIIRGLQRGAASFGTSTASAALELSNRLVQAIQATAETVYDILSPAAPPLPRTLLDRKHSRRLRRGHQPADLREGVAKAYDTVREGVIDTAQAICDVAARGHEQKGITGAVGGVLRQIPPTVVKPLIVASEATSNLLGGMRNQIKPDARKEEALKWRSEEAQE
uniref:Autophagy related 2A n=1 Tax=Varanus komodoensis TaxID=61221 RepID=A0A8D2IVI6_VARKO